VLTLVLADCAALWRFGPVGVLNAACGADVSGHDVLLADATVRAPTLSMGDRVARLGGTVEVISHPGAEMCVRGVLLPPTGSRLDVDHCPTWISRRPAP